VHGDRTQQRRHVRTTVTTNVLGTVIIPAGGRLVAQVVNTYTEDVWPIGPPVPPVPPVPPTPPPHPVLPATGVPASLPGIAAAGLVLILAGHCCSSRVDSGEIPDLTVPHRFARLRQQRNELFRALERL